MKPTQTLNDGIVKIYSIANISPVGDAPVEKLSLKKSLAFKRRMVGVERLYKAKQVNARVDMLLRCHYMPDVGGQDIAIINGGISQYSVTDVQYIEDSAPPMMDLTLERLAESYELP